MQCDAGAVILGDIAHDGQSQTAAGGTVVEAIETIKNQFAFRQWNTRSGIFHRQDAAILGRLATYRHRSLRRRIANRIVDQIVDQVAQQEGIAHDKGRVQIETEIDVFLVGLIDKMLDRCFHQFAQFQLFQLPFFEAARLGAGQCQQLIGLADHALG